MRPNSTYKFYSIDAAFLNYGILNGFNASLLAYFFIKVSSCNTISLRNGEAYLLAAFMKRNGQKVLALRGEKSGMNHLDPVYMVTDQN